MPVAPALPTSSPSWASSKLTALISAPAPKARTRPTCRGDQRCAKLSNAPMTSELAASAPQPIAAPISATLLTMTLVVKLGSSIVAADDGELRTDVLDSVCAQVSALEQGGERVVMVTSGAIARGMRLMELPVRPRAMDELQGASAVGQGDLFRAYESRLAAQGTRAAQVLLTAADIAARTNYLNARQTLRRLIEWGVVPVVNENDTTATDEITFGDNDFLAAQVAILLDARLLVLLTNTDGLHTADPSIDGAAERIPEVTDFSELAGLEIGDRTAAFGSGGMRSKVAAAEMASESGIPAVVCDGTNVGTLTAAAAGDRVGTRFAAQATRASSFKLW